MPRFKAGDKRIKYIQKGLRLGMSRTAIYNEMKNTEFGGRKTDVLATARWLKGVEREASTIQYTKKHLKPSHTTFAKTPYRQSWNYLYEGRFSGINRKTGKYDTMPYRYGTDKIDTVGAVEEWVRAGVEGVYFDNIVVTTEAGYRI